MGVPFEALIPYAIMLGVRTSLPLNETQEATDTFSDVRRHRSGPFQDPIYAKRREKTQICDRPMGPSECALPPGGKHELPLMELAVMDRDRRLTGFLRGQTDNVEAPPGFELNNPWRVSILDHNNKARNSLTAKQTEKRIY